MDVMELADAGGAAGAHLAITATGNIVDFDGIHAACLRIHLLAPGPEIVVRIGRVDSLNDATQVALEGMRMRIDEAGRERRVCQAQCVGRRLSGRHDSGDQPTIDLNRKVAADTIGIENEIGEKPAHVVIPGRSRPPLLAACLARS